MKNINQIVEKITKIKQLKSNQTIFIAIDGRGGSGKSTVAKILKNNLPNSYIFHLDDIAYPTTDKDRKYLIEKIITPLLTKKPTNYQIKNHVNGNIEHIVLKPGIVLIIEGVLALHDMLNKYYDYRIWIECPPEIGYERGILRDKLNQGVDNSIIWKEEWIPQENELFDSQKPQSKADIVIDGTIPL